MDADYARAFRDYGIDVWALPRAEAGRRLRESALAVQLADALELWMSTQLFLVGYDPSALAAGSTGPWLELMNAADPDPARSARRELVYVSRGGRDALQALLDEVDFESTTPRELSWLASACAGAGDRDTALEILRRAELLYPDDAMLRFDYGYTLQALGRYEEAARQAWCAISIRPRTGGLWRFLATILRDQGDVAGALDAMERSAHHEPEHAPTWMDLGALYGELGRTEDAVRACGEAVALEPEDALAHGRLGLALQAAGRLPEALEALERCHALGQLADGWSHPSAEWLEACRRELEGR